MTIDEPRGATLMDPSLDKVTEVYEKIADILLVLADVASGDYSPRLRSDLPETHPLGALCVGINDMIEALAAEQRRSEEYRTEVEEKLATIEQQRAAIRELSTPIMEVWDGILCLPIVGIMDSARSADMTDALLKSVVSTRASCAIIDITGINPQIAQTVVHMGVNMEGVVTHRSLRDALQHFIARRRAQRALQQVKR